MISKKTVTLLIYSLLIFSILTPLISSNTTSLNNHQSTHILYVGGTGSNNYSSIQQAVNAAAENDTLFVYNGVYQEHIEIDKSINLLGENRQNTIIDGEHNGNVIQITSDKVNISEFTIKKSGSTTMNAGIKLQSNQSTITNNNIINNGNDAIFMKQSSFNIISNNYFSSNQHNTISLQDNSNNNTITNNTIHNTTHRSISLINHCLNNTIQHNLINSTQMLYAVHCSLYSSTNIIHNNTLLRNNKAIYLEKSSNNCTISSNHILNNSKGICLKNIKHTQITNNYIINNSQHGIQLGDMITEQNATNNTIQKNIIKSNQNIGLLIDYNSQTNKIYNNSFIKNQYPIYILHTNDDNRLYHNTFLNNTHTAYDDSINMWHHGDNRGGNYWDKYTGTDEDNDGFGDEPYFIPGDGENNDTYPLITPFVNPSENHHPIAQFTYTPTTPSTQDSITFTDSSSDSDGSIISWKWEFGDNNTSLQKNPTHQYEKKGTYIVNLTVTDNNMSTNSTSQTISVNTGIPRIFFDYTPENPTIEDTISFEDKSHDLDGSITSWYWNFDDGNTSTRQHPSHQYSSPSEYNVTLQITDDDGLQNQTFLIVEVEDKNDPPVASFTVKPSTPYTLDSIEFESTSTDDETITNYTWTIDDDIVLYGREVTYSFSNSGTYEVKLTVTDNENDKDTIIKEVTVKKHISVKITSPEDKSTVSNTLIIEGTAFAKENIETVKLKIDDNEFKEVSGSTDWEYSWDTTKNEDGEYTILVRCTDTKGDSIDDSITVTVKNTVNQKPSIEITYPTNNMLISENITITGNATDDNRNINSVEIKIDQGIWQPVLLIDDNFNTWEYELNKSMVSSGNHTIYARSFDGEKYSDVESVKITIEENDQSDPDNTDDPDDSSSDEKQNDFTETTSDENGEESEDGEMTLFLAIISTAIIATIGAVIYIIRI